MPVNTIDLDIFQADSYGDTWNGGSLTISDSNGVTVLATSGPATAVAYPAGLTQTISVETGTYTYTMVPGEYPSEIVATITDESGTLLASLVGGSGTGTFVVGSNTVITPVLSVSDGDVTVSATLNADAITAGATHWAYSFSALGAEGEPHGGTLTALGASVTVTPAYVGEHTVYVAAVDSAGNVIVGNSDTINNSPSVSVTIVKTDSYNDGWDGTSLVITHVSTGDVVHNATLAVGVSPETIPMNLLYGDYTWALVGGNYLEEHSVIITQTADGIVLANSAASVPSSGSFTVGPPSAAISVDVAATGTNIAVTGTPNAAATAEGAANWSASLTGFGEVGATIDGAKALTAIGADAALTAPSGGSHSVYVAVVDAAGVILAKADTTVNIFISQLNVGDGIIVMSYLDHPNLSHAGTHDQLTSDDEGNSFWGPFYIGDLTIKSLSISSQGSNEILTDVTFDDGSGGDLDLDALVKELIKKYNLNLLSGVQSDDGTFFQSVIDGTAGFSASALLSWEAEGTSTIMLPSGGGHYAEYDAVFYGNQISEALPGEGWTAGPDGSSFVGIIAPGETAPAQAGSSYDPFHGGNLSNIIKYVHGTDGGAYRSHMHVKNDDGNTVLYFTQDLQTWSAFTSYGPDAHGIYDAPACAAYGPAGKVFVGTEAGCAYLIDLDASSAPLSFTKVHDNGNTGKINQVHFGATSNTWIIEYSEKVYTMPAEGGALTERMTIPTGAVVVDISEAADAICIVVRKSDFTFASYIALTNWSAVYDESQMSTVLTSLGIADFNYAYNIDKWCAASPDGTVITTDDISNWLL